MRKWKSVVSALLLTVLLIGVALLNGAELFADANAVMGESQVTYAAAAKLPEIRIKLPHYDDDHNLIGCWGKGNGCVIVVVTVAGAEREVYHWVYE